MMKLDKEYVAKHHFWFLLATYAPLVLLSLVLLWTSVAAAIDKRAEEIKTLKEDVKGVDTPDVKTQKWIDGFHKKAEALDAQKNLVWGQVWNGQATVFTWPETLAKLQNFDFGDPIPETVVRDTYNSNSDCYRKQFKELPERVQPVDDKGEGVVQFNGGPAAVIQHVSKWLSGRQTVPSSEDI